MPTLPPRRAGAAVATVAITAVVAVIGAASVQATPVSPPSPCADAKAVTKLVATLSPPPGFTNFGQDLAVDGRNMVIAGGDVNNTATAFFYAYDDDTGKWSFLQHEVIDDSTASGNGRVALRGRRAVLGTRVFELLATEQRWVQTAWLPNRWAVNGSYVSPLVTIGANNGAYTSALGNSHVVETFIERNGVWTAAPNISVAGTSNAMTNGRPFYDASTDMLYQPLEVFASSMSSYWVRVFQADAGGSLTYVRDLVTPNRQSPTAWNVGEYTVAHGDVVVVPYMGNNAKGGVFVYKWEENEEVRSGGAAGAGKYVEMWNATSEYTNGDAYGSAAAVDATSGFVAVGARYSNPSPSPFVYLYWDSFQPMVHSLQCWTLPPPVWTPGGASNFGANVAFWRASEQPDFKNATGGDAASVVMIVTNSFGGPAVKTPSGSSQAGEVLVFSVTVPTSAE